MTLFRMRSRRRNPLDSESRLACGWWVRFARRRKLMRVVKASRIVQRFDEKITVPYAIVSLFKCVSRDHTTLRKSPVYVLRCLEVTRARSFCSTSARHSMSHVHHDVASRRSARDPSRFDEYARRMSRRFFVIRLFSRPPRRVERAAPAHAGPPVRSKLRNESSGGRSLRSRSVAPLSLRSPAEVPARAARDGALDGVRVGHGRRAAGPGSSRAWPPHNVSRRATKMAMAERRRSIDIARPRDHAIARSCDVGRRGPSRALFRDRQQGTTTDKQRARRDRSRVEDASPRGEGGEGGVVAHRRVFWFPFPTTMRRASLARRRGAPSPPPSLSLDHRRRAHAHGSTRCATTSTRRRARTTSARAARGPRCSRCGLPPPRAAATVAASSSAPGWGTVTQPAAKGGQSS